MIKLSPIHAVQPGSTLHAVRYYAPHHRRRPSAFDQDPSYHLCDDIGVAMFVAIEAWAAAGEHPETPPLVCTVATFQKPPTNDPDGCVPADPPVHVAVAAIHVEPTLTAPGPHSFTEDQRVKIAGDLLGSRPDYEDVPIAPPFLG